MNGPVFPRVAQGGGPATGGVFPYIADRCPVPWSRQSDYGLAAIMDWWVDGVTDDHRRAAAQEWVRRYPDGLDGAVKHWARTADRIARKEG